MGRRSKEEREAIEKLEADRHQERLAEAAAKQRGRPLSQVQRGGGGGGGGGNRGRGSVRGPGAGGGARRGRGGIVLTSTSRQSSLSRRSQTRSIIQANNRGASNSDSISSDESDSDVRMSIDRINLESDNELDPEPDVKGKKVAKPLKTRGADGLRPVRVPWIEHEERVVSVNMESSSKKSAEIRKEANQSRDGADDVPGQVQSGTDNMIDDSSDTLFVPDYGEAEKLNASVKSRVKEEPMEVEGEGLEAIPCIDDQEQERDESRDAGRSHLRTKEVIEEFDRHETDLKVMRELFTTDRASPATSSTIEGTTEEQVEDKPDKLAGQLFLMQFPPMTPNLTIPGLEGETSMQGNASSDTQISVKREEGNTEATGPIEIIEPPEEPALESAGPPPQVVTATDRRLEAGRVGKLNVHASGRVTMDWGGILMELDRATVVDFLQEALIVSRDDEVDEGQGKDDDERTVWAMGKLSGKFLITPEWDGILG